MESTYQIGFVSIVNHNNLVLWEFRGGFFFPLECGTYGYKIYKSYIIAKAAKYAFLGVNESKKRILGTIFVNWEHLHKIGTS